MPDIELDDAALGARVRSGDDGAFTLFYERYSARLYDFTARLVRDQAAAEDLVQASFTRAYEHRQSLRDPAKVKSWLFTTAHNLAMNHLQRRPDEPVEERWDLATPGPGPEDEAVTRDASELVWTAAASLEPRQYAVLDMSVRQELTTPEIADVLGLSTAHAAVVLNRAKEALGNAVRYLMVARRRDHCERLAKLVPAGVRVLTAEQRSTVDHHMRHCEDCQVMARRLTAPAELFGGLALLPVPADLAKWRGWPAQPTPQPGRSGGPTPHHGLGRLGWGKVGLFGGVSAVVIVGAIVALVAATRHGATAPASRPPSAQTSLDLALLSTRQFSRVGVPGVSSGPSGVFVDATCPSATVCYVVGGGSSGVVVTTRDGGQSWTSATVPGTAQLSAVTCAAATRCWVAGTAPNGDGVILATSDGRRWSQQTSKAGLVVESMACPTMNDCIAVGTTRQQGVVDAVATTDGGGTWQVRAVPNNAFTLTAVRCHDAGSCIAVGSGAWTTADVGSTWHDTGLAPAPPSPGQTVGSLAWQLIDVTYISASDIWVVGGVQCGGSGATQCPAFIFHTVDGGRSWTPNASAPPQSFAYGWQIRCQGSTCLLVTQAFHTSSILLTSGGATWHQTQTVSGQLNALACSSGGFCVVAGRDTSGPDLFLARQP